MEWRLWAHKRDYGFAHIGAKRYVELHIMSDPIVPVLVTEREGGKYYGWIRAGQDTPTMIFPTELMFSMCFPYGYEASEKAGHGRVVRLDVVERTDCQAQS